MTNYFLHPSADVKSTSIGSGTKIWQFCVVLEGAVIGRNCNICSHCFIENDVVIGDDVTVKNNNSIYDGMLIEDNVFIGPNVTFTNDKYPRSKHWPDKFFKTIIKKGASIGGGAVVLPGIIIGEGAMIGAGSVVTKDVPSYTVVRGNPARDHGSLKRNISANSDK